MRLAARYWTGSVRFDLGDDTITVAFDDGRLVTDAGDSGDPSITLTAPAELWTQILLPVPPPFLNDIAPAQALGLHVGGDPETFWQYYPAIRRLVDLLRESRAQ